MDKSWTVIKSSLIAADCCSHTDCISSGSGLFKVELGNDQIPMTDDKGVRMKNSKPVCGGTGVWDLVSRICLDTRHWLLILLLAVAGCETVPDTAPSWRQQTEADRERNLCGDGWKSPPPLLQRTPYREAIPFSFAASTSVWRL